MTSLEPQKISPGIYRLNTTARLVVLFFLSFHLIIFLFVFIFSPFIVLSHLIWTIFDYIHVQNASAALSVQ